MKEIGHKISGHPVYVDYGGHIQFGDSVTSIEHLKNVIADAEIVANAQNKQRARVIKKLCGEAEKLGW
jgi:hypothetical protein